MSGLSKQTFLAAVARGETASRTAVAARQRATAMRTDTDGKAELDTSAERAPLALLPEELAVVALLQRPSEQWAEVDLG